MEAAREHRRLRRAWMSPHLEDLRTDKVEGGEESTLGWGWCRENREAKGEELARSQAGRIIQPNTVGRELGGGTRTGPGRSRTEAVKTLRARAKVER